MINFLPHTVKVKEEHLPEGWDKDDECHVICIDLEKDVQIETSELPDSPEFDEDDEDAEEEKLEQNGKITYNMDINFLVANPKIGTYNWFNISALTFVKTLIL